MTFTSGEPIQEKILALASNLVKIPSRGGIDPTGPVLNFISQWFTERAIPVQRLNGNSGKDVGIYIHLKASMPGPALCLNACIDTAPFGDEDAWTLSPTSGAIQNGRLYGRGAADSKIGVAIFSHLASQLVSQGGLPRGDLFIVFDADEHTGKFFGIKTFLEVIPRQPDAVLIGYPGNEKVISGSRGFLRVVITVFGTAAHSGSGSAKGFNAIAKMAHLVNAMQSEPLPTETDPDFNFGPQINVTEITGGQGYSIIPDRCTCKVDLRLTPNVNKAVASAWLQKIIDAIDHTHPGPKPTEIEWHESWPAYHLPAENQLVINFLESAQNVFHKKIPAKVSGPSNIGNYLASRHIPALSGFGVTYWNVHGIDENIDISTIVPVFETYYTAVQRLLEKDSQLQDKY